MSPDPDVALIDEADSVLVDEALVPLVLAGTTHREQPRVEVIRLVGDLVSVHANLVRVGRTSITVHLEAWVLRRKDRQSILVTDGNFTYVSIDEQCHPQAIKQDGMIST